MSFNKISYDELNSEDKKVLYEAELALENAYDPYSGFHVGAAALAEDGQIYKASNRGNARSGNTTCAEGNVASIVSANGNRKITHIAVIGRHENGTPTESFTAPCGSCRQDIYELAQISGNDIICILSDTKKEHIIKTTISKLLPLAFGPKDLGIDVTKYR